MTALVEHTVLDENLGLVQDAVKNASVMATDVKIVGGEFVANAFIMTLVFAYQVAVLMSNQQ